MKTTFKVEISSEEGLIRSSSFIHEIKDGYRIDFEIFTIQGDRLVKGDRKSEEIYTDSMLWPAFNRHIVIPKDDLVYVVGPGSLLAFKEGVFGEDDYSQAAMEYFESKVDPIAGERGTLVHIYPEGVTLQVGRKRVVLSKEMWEDLKDFLN